MRAQNLRELREPWHQIRTCMSTAGRMRSRCCRSCNSRRRSRLLGRQAPPSCSSSLRWQSSSRSSLRPSRSWCRLGRGLVWGSRNLSRMLASIRPSASRLWARGSSPEVASHSRFQRIVLQSRSTAGCARRTWCMSRSRCRSLSSSSLCLFQFAHCIPTCGLGSSGPCRNLHCESRTATHQSI